MELQQPSALLELDACSSASLQRLHLGRGRFRVHQMAPLVLRQLPLLVLLGPRSEDLLRWPWLNANYTCACASGPARRVLGIDKI